MQVMGSKGLWGITTPNKEIISLIRLLPPFHLLQLVIRRGFSLVVFQVRAAEEDRRQPTRPPTALPGWQRRRRRCKCYYFHHRYDFYPSIVLNPILPALEKGALITSE